MRIRLCRVEVSRVFLYGSGRGGGGEGGKLTLSVNQDARVSSVGAEEHRFFIGELVRFCGGCALGGIVDAFEKLFGGDTLAKEKKVEVERPEITVSRASSVAPRRHRRCRKHFFTCLQHR